MKALLTFFLLFFSSYGFAYQPPHVDFYTLTTIWGSPIQVTKYTGDNIYVHTKCTVVLRRMEAEGGGPIKGCAWWGERNCLIFTIDDKNVIEHEERHCREGHFH